MYKACYNNRRDLLDLMIANGETDFDYGLEGACEGGNMELYKYMLSFTTLHNPLISACRGGNINIVKDIVLNNFYNNSLYQAAILDACSHGHIEIVNYMLSLGLKIDQFQAFTASCEGGNIELIKKFVNDDHCMGLNNACKGGHIEVVEFLIDNSKNNDYDSALAGACHGGNIDVVNFIISKGANKFNNGLFYSARGGHIEIVKLLLEKGANEYIRGLLGACRGGQYKIVELFLSIHNYDIDEYNEAFEVACSSENIDIIKLLILKGADDYDYLKYRSLGCKILYMQLTRKITTLPIKKEHPQYHLLKVYRYKIPDIDRLINKYLF